MFPLLERYKAFQAEAFDRTRALQAEYNAEITKLSTKYTRQIEMIGAESQLYSTNVMQEICKALDIKFVPGGSDGYYLISDTMPLGFAFLTHIPPDEDDGSAGGDPPLTQTKGTIH